MQVKVHLSEGLLHVLDMVGGVADKVRPVSPVGTQDAYLVVGTKRTGQEPIGVNTLENWQSETLPLRPGTFFTWRAFTRFT